MNKEKCPIVYILPNNDAGGIKIKELIINNKRNQDMVFSNLVRDNYLFLLKNCEFIIGNSSSGLLEAPIFKKVCINIGNRQKDRVQGDNVVNCNYEDQDILKAITYARESDELRKKLEVMISPYGEKPASKKIVDHLEEKNNFSNEFLFLRGVTY